MVDYAKLADELKARQSGADSAAEMKLREQQALRAFLKSVELKASQEINQANPELNNRGLLSGEYVAGLTMSRDPGTETLRLRFGRTRECTVTLDLARYRIDAVMRADPRNAYSRDHQRGFTATFLGAQLKVFSEPSGSYPIKPSTEVQPQDIAEIAVSGIIRGTFD